MATSKRKSLATTFDQAYIAWRKSLAAYQAAFQKAEKERRLDCAEVKRAFDLTSRIFDRASRLTPSGTKGMRDYLHMLRTWDISESPSEVQQSLRVFRRWVDIQAREGVSHLQL